MTLLVSAHDLDRHGLPDRELTDRYDEFVGIGNRAFADFDEKDPAKPRLRR